MERITVTNQIRKEMARELERAQGALATERHVSGDFCAHCDLKSEIKFLTEALANGYWID